ncbi:DUF4296 domain-containing protein [bacterium]|nr:MAG: DUF4296 domain-containing protein [bacterium]
MELETVSFSLLLLCFCACNRNSKPDNLIEENRFVPLLVDIHLADGYLSTKPQMPDSLSYYGNGLYTAIFKKYEVDSVQFKKSFQYYSLHLEQMSRIYKDVVEQLTAKNDSITKKLAAEEMKRQRHAADSVKKALKIDSVRKAAKLDSVKKQLKINQPNPAAKDLVKKK